MHAIVSMLDEEHFERLKDIWRDLEADCGLAGVHLTPLPHFSWQTASQYDFDRLKPLLSNISAEAQPFFVRTTGIGVFSGELPVVYIPVVKDAPMSGFHGRLWQQVKPTAIGISSHYAPEVWVPHITLAYGDVNRFKLGCAMEKLAFQPLNWEVQVNHLALVFQYSGQVGEIDSIYPFGGGGSLILG